MLSCLLWSHKARVQFKDEILKRGLQYTVNNVTNQIFQTIEKLIKRDKWTLSLLK